MKKIFIFLFIFILISGCTKTKIQPVTYQEVNKFIADNYLQALDFKLVGDIAIILFEDEVRTGYYLLYKNEDNTLKSKLAFGLSDSTQPVIIYASSSAIPFVSLIIRIHVVLWQHALQCFFCCDWRESVNRLIHPNIEVDVCAYLIKFTKYDIR